MIQWLSLLLGHDVEYLNIASRVSKEDHRSVLRLLKSNAVDSAEVRMIFILEKLVIDMRHLLETNDLALNIIGSFIETIKHFVCFDQVRFLLVLIFIEFYKGFGSSSVIDVYSQSRAKFHLLGCGALSNAIEFQIDLLLFFI